MLHTQRWGAVQDGEVRVRGCTLWEVDNASPTRDGSICIAHACQSCVRNIATRLVRQCGGEKCNGYQLKQMKRQKRIWLCRAEVVPVVPHPEVRKARQVPCVVTKG